MTIVTSSVYSFSFMYNILQFLKLCFEHVQKGVSIIIIIIFILFYFKKVKNISVLYIYIYIYKIYVCILLYMRWGRDLLLFFSKRKKDGLGTYNLFNQTLL